MDKRNIGTKLDGKAILWRNEYYRVTGYNKLKGEYTLVNLKTKNTSWEPIEVIDEEAEDMIEERKRICDYVGLNEDDVAEEYGDNWEDCMNWLYNCEIYREHEEEQSEREYNEMMQREAENFGRWLREWN